MEIFDIAKIDKNFAADEVNEAGINFYDVREAPFRVYGLYDYRRQEVFKRLPDEVAKNVNAGVATLYLDTAGGRVRFSTDSTYIVIYAELHHVRQMLHMPITGSNGFDLYLDNEALGSRYMGTFIPQSPRATSYKARVEVGGAGVRSYTINFPLYCGVKNLYVGIAEGSKILPGATYKSNLPIVYYGSSITQGGCASRPGNCYQNVIAQRLNFDYINLGFSGNGRGEDSIIDYMASLEMLAFVSDYDHNAPNPEHLKRTHMAMYRKIRDAHPTIPYIMISKVDFDKNAEDSVLRRQAILENFSEAYSSGDRNVYLIDGENVFREPYRNMCTVDGTHPNDLGFALMADVIGGTLARALTGLF